MNCRTLRISTVAALFATTGSTGAPRAQSLLPEFIAPPVATVAVVAVPEDPWTTLTMAPDGSWGVMTSISVGEAISGAIAACKSMSGPKIGCGSKFKTTGAKWVLGVRCGSENILVATENLADAELAAMNRESELRHVYARNIPACERVVTVDPGGLVASSRSRSAKSKLEQHGIELIQQ